MADIQIRPTNATDLPRLMGMNHSISSDSVWQLELRRDGGQILATFREVRLPRPTMLTYPHNPFSLADDWTHRAVMYTALSGVNPVGYISLMERGAASIAWVVDLVVDVTMRRQGVAGTLLAAAQEWAEGHSYRLMILEMQSKNIPAIRLAQKFGYEFCGYNDHYYMTQDVAIFFARSIK
jgi:RimJ/RimL family protein N-acetyltransferase